MATVIFHNWEDRHYPTLVRRLGQAVWASLIITVAANAEAQVVSPNAGAAATGPQPPAATPYQGEYFTTDLTEVFRLRHMEGDGQGDVPAYTNFGFTKFAWGSRGVLMFDLAARLTNDAEPGFTVGVHRRVVYGDVILGAGLFFDEQEYHQGSAAFELFTPQWAFRANGYAILGEDVEEDADYEATGATTIYFEDNFIFADNLNMVQEYEVAMNGFDLEAARRIGGYSTEAFVGGYFYDGELGESATGAKAGVRGFLLPDLAGSVMVSGDDVFGTNVFAGLTWFVGARGGLSRPDVTRRLTIPVERNEQVVVNEFERRELVTDPIALTDDEDPIFVVHVQSGAAGTLEGTFENPFDALPDTQDADIVYVHANGVFVNQSYELAAGQRFLGEGDGNQHLVDTDELGDIILPAGNGLATRPVIQAAPGNAITLSDEGEVSNFSVQNAVGHGIFGDHISEFDVNRNVVTGSGGSGIFLNNVIEPDPRDFLAKGKLVDNVSTGNFGPAIRLVLLGDFEGEVTGNTASGSTGAAAQGILVEGLVSFDGEVSGNTAENNVGDGITIAVDQFFGDIEGNTASSNGANGMTLTFEVFDGDVEGNTTSDNNDNGIDFSIAGSGLSEAEITGNTAENNGGLGMSLLFGGTGTSLVEVRGNTFGGNNGGVGAEFLAENEDVHDNRPITYIFLDGNTSTNALANPPFNYEFVNLDLFDGDGEMYLELGTNVGTVGTEGDVEFEEFP